MKLKRSNLIMLIITLIIAVIALSCLYFNRSKQMDEVTKYILCSWGLFMLIILPLGEGLVLLIDWVFQKFNK